MKNISRVIVGTLVLTLCSFCLLTSAVAQPSASNWERITFPFPNTTYANSSFADSNIGYFGGRENQSSNSWFRTIDGGRTWTRIEFQGLTQGEVKAITTDYISTPTPNTLFIEKKNSSSFLMSVVSDDTGKTFRLYEDPKQPMRFFKMLTPSFGYLFSVLGGLLNFTTDSARSYLARDYNEDLDYYSSLNIQNNNVLFDYSDSNHLLFSCPTLDSFIVLQSSDAGVTWNKLILNTGLNGRYGVFGEVTYLKETPNVWLNPNKMALSPHFLPVGYYYSEDYGSTWKINRTYFNRIDKLAPVGTGRLWATLNVNGGQVLGYTSDNGTSWNIDSTTTKGYTLSSLQFIDSLHGWAVGMKGEELAIFRYSPSSIPASVQYKPHTTNATIIFTANPASEQTTVSLSNHQEIGSVQMYNMLGKEIIVKHTPQQRSCTIATASLPNGIYLLKISTANGIVMGKLQVSHY